MAGNMHPHRHPGAMSDIYESGRYWDDKASMHEEDSDFKVNHALALLKRNNFHPASIVDCGCGAGRVSWLFAKNLDAPTLGVDVSDRSIDHAGAAYRHARLSFRKSTIAALQDGAYDLGVMFDVFEHVDDYLGFLRIARPKARHWLFNIPLDMSVMHLIDGTYMERRRRIGHLHYFTEASALATLEDTGFSVIDRQFANYHRQSIAAAPSITQKLRLWPGRLAFRIHQSAAVKLFGGASLQVLCSSENMSIAPNAEA